MEDHFGKYLRLFGTIFFTVIGFIISIALVLLGIRLFFGLLSYVPWTVYLYMILIVMLPATLFIPIYIIYLKRTRSHPAKLVRWISYILFSVAILAWVILLVWDIITFFKHTYPDIEMYRSYNMLFLAANVGCIFLAGVMQAFTTEKEKDWMEKSRQQ